MLLPRVIPVLLLMNRGLWKTVKFKAPKYIGDPMNAVRIFNEKEVDEIALLDITATVEGRSPSFGLIKDIASECFMPLAYGGGVTTVEDMARLFQIGIEKVIVNARATEDPAFITKAAERFGRQSVIVSIDVKKKWLGGYDVVTRRGRQGTGSDPVEFAARMQEAGAGELLVTAVDRDGTMEGYDLDITRRIAEQSTIPVIACGGAGNLSHVAEAVRRAGASAVAAGSMFVLTGKHRAVLISYPSQTELRECLT